MATTEVMDRLESAIKDLKVMRSGPNYRAISASPDLSAAMDSAESLALRWKNRLERLSVQNIKRFPDPLIQSLTAFINRLAEIADRRGLGQGTIASALQIARSTYEQSVPSMVLAYIEATQFLDMPSELEASKSSALKEIGEAFDSSKQEVSNLSEKLQDEIRQTAKDAVQEYETAKENASRISVDAARTQFTLAETHLRNRAYTWAALALLQFAALIFILRWLFMHPPTIIIHIEDLLASDAAKPAPPVSVPLLLAASAYFTAVRLALIGVLGIGLAISLRMMRAYFHMREHNEHKLRVTNSIEAFVAAVRTKEQKDLVLGKLVESVTEFGDSGILAKQAETSVLPSVFMEAITKNVGKSE